MNLNLKKFHLKLELRKSKKQFFLLLPVFATSPIVCDVKVVAHIWFLTTI